MKKRVFSSLLAALLAVMTCLSPFALDSGSVKNLIDDPLQYYLKNQVTGTYDGTGTTIICPSCGYSVTYTGGTLATCPYCGEAMVVKNSDGSSTFKVGGGKAGTGGVGRPKAYKEDNTPNVTSSGLYTMYVHPQFCRTGGRPEKAGTFNAMRDGVIQEDSFYSQTIETNRLYVSYRSDSGRVLYVGGRVYYKITAPVTGHYEFKEWSASTVKSGNGFLSLDSHLSIASGEVNLSKGNTEEALYFYYE